MCDDEGHPDMKASPTDEEADAAALKCILNICSIRLYYISSFFFFTSAQCDNAFALFTLFRGISGALTQVSINEL